MTFLKLDFSDSINSSEVPYSVLTSILNNYIECDSDVYGVIFGCYDEKNCCAKVEATAPFSFNEDGDVDQKNIDTVSQPFIAQGKKIVGWYSTELNQFSSGVHNFFSQTSTAFKPIFLHVDLKSLAKGGRFPIKCFVRYSQK
jgi:hypothetical protein